MLGGVDVPSTMASRFSARAQPALLATALALCTGGAFFVVQGVPQQVAYHCLSAGSAGAVLIGVRLHRPEATAPWVLMAAGLLVMTVADVAGDLVRSGAGVPDVLPPVLYVMAWGLLAYAVRALALHRAPEGDRDAVLDAAAIVLAVALVLWRALLEPALRGPGEAALTSAAVALFPLAQIALLALYLRLLFGGGARLVSVWVLALGGGVCGLAGSTAYTVLVATDAYAPGAWNNALWMAAYAAPGIAALLPDMKQLTEPAAPGSDLSMSRWTLLAAALVTTTATTSVTATRMSTPEVVAAALPVPLVVLWRLRRVLLARQEAVAYAEQTSRRHQLLARLGALAVSSDISALRAEACAALAEELRAEVRLVPTAECSLALGVLSSPVPTAPGPWRSLQADAGRSRRWTGGERSLLESVANVLTAVEARDASQRHVRWAADHDALTGLANRRQLMEVLDGRSGGDRPTTLLLLDLDGFKEVNDRHGHEAGDAVLVAAAERLRQVCRDSDLVARLAGDEFVVLCPEELSPGDQVALVSRIRQALTRPVPIDGGNVAVSASIGIATSRLGEPLTELVRTADARMYEDKRTRAKHLSQRRPAAATRN